jgi:mannose/fructose/N-acetylgalactosamine-specific phosphotransferase system component IIC
VSWHVLATVLLGGVAVLDATPVAQTMLSQPLVTATLLGLIWGDWRVALEVGVVLQLLAASTLPIGSRAPEDYATGGVVGAGVALAAAAQHPFLMVQEAAALAGVIAGIVAALLGVPLVKWQRRRNEGLSRWCEAEVRRGHEGAIGSAQRAGIVLAFGVGVGYSAICLALGAWLLGPVVAGHSLRLARAWALAQPLWIGLGLAQIVQAFVRRRLTRAVGYLVAVTVAWFVLILAGH